MNRNEFYNNIQKYKDNNSITHASPLLGTQKSNAKYIKRTGKPGAYVYTYKDSGTGADKDKYIGEERSEYEENKRQYEADLKETEKKEEAYAKNDTGASVSKYAEIARNSGGKSGAKAFCKDDPQYKKYIEAIEKEIKNGNIKIEKVGKKCYISWGTGYNGPSDDFTKASKDIMSYINEINAASGANGEEFMNAVNEDLQKQIHYLGVINHFFTAHDAKEIFEKIANGDYDDQLAAYERAEEPEEEKKTNKLYDFEKMKELIGYDNDFWENIKEEGFGPDNYKPGGKKESKMKSSK